MAIVIVNGHQKGGVGKSTINWCSCHTLSKNYGYKILFIDTDWQGSIFNRRLTNINTEAQTLIPLFKDQFPNASAEEIFQKAVSYVKQNESDIFNFNIVHSELINVKETIIKNYNDFNLIFVDIPGIFKDINGSDKIMMEFYDMVDIILSPLTPGNYDEDSSLYFKQKLEELQKRRKKDEGVDMDVWFYYNKYQDKRAKTASLEESVELFKYPMLNTKIPYWDDFNAASIIEDSIINISNSNPGTKRVWSSFMDEIDEIIKQYS